MLFLDYEYHPTITSKMVAFCLTHFGYLPEYADEFSCLRIRFRTEKEMSFFLLYWSDKANAIS